MESIHEITGLDDIQTAEDMTPEEIYDTLVLMEETDNNVLDHILSCAGINCGKYSE